MEKGYEYNDETYDITNGEPVNVFKDIKAAKEKADKLNFERLKTERILQSSRGVDRIFDDIGEFLTKLNKITGESLTEDELNDEYDWSLPHMTYEQYLTLKKHIDLEFYEVVECAGE